jgi:hypothetical protein
MRKLAIALVFVAATSVGGRCLAQPQEPQAGGMTSSTNSALVEDLIRLWKANLSEEFINKYFAHSDLARDLTAEDVVKLRAAGVPETLISSITLRRGDTVTSTGMPRMGPGSQEPRRWDGLTRRNGGLVILKSRWDAGVLEFKEGSLRWMDSKDTSKNILLAATQLTEQQLTCLKKAGGNECFEWVVKTRGEEYRFRDVGWSQGENAKVEELFRFFSGAYPNLISSRNAVDEK